jgi:hypothetical protein
MFENQAGELECVGCGRRVQVHPFKVISKGDFWARHSFGVLAVVPAVN